MDKQTRLYGTLAEIKRCTESIMFYANSAEKKRTSPYHDPLLKEKIAALHDHIDTIESICSSKHVSSDIT